MSTLRSYELAGFWERLIALIIDSILFGFIGGLVGLNVDLIGGGLVSIVLGIGYQWYFLTQHNGQTPGKMLMKLRVIKTDGSKISDTDVVLRYIGYLVNSPFFMLGWLWIFFDSRSQGWHDKLARTFVVKANSEVELVETKRKNDHYVTV